MEVVNGLLAKLAHDADFQEDLKKPQVQVVSPYIATYIHTHTEHMPARQSSTHTPHTTFTHTNKQHRP
jgi:hypothetical protein